MTQEAAQQVLAVLSAACSAAGAMSQHLQIGDGVVGQRVGFQPGPQVFDGVKFGGIRRQIFQVRRAWRYTFVDEGALVSREAIPDQHDGGAQLMLKVLEEVPGAHGIDVGVRVQLKMQREAVACGRDAQRGNGRDLLVSSDPRWRNSGV